SEQDDNGFIDRWARRKAENKGGLRRVSSQEKPEIVRGRMITDPLPAAVAEDDEDSAVAPVDMAHADPDAVPAGEVAAVDEHESGPDEDQDLESVDIDALGYDADFTRFMQPGVPEAIRQRALRRLWRTNPILANVDGLNDYDEDFSDAALAVDVIKSGYKVGQGYLSDDDVAERDAERLGEDADVAEVAVAGEAADEAEVAADGAKSEDGAVDGDEDLASFGGSAEKAEPTSV
ncbi:MAG: DUF3306 domain-containing protein, partial [Hyphomicrobiaceae bacterium]